MACASCGDFFLSSPGSYKLWDGCATGTTVVQFVIGGVVVEYREGRFDTNKRKWRTIDDTYGVQVLAPRHRHLCVYGFCARQPTPSSAAI